MNTMFQVDDYFVRIKDYGGRLKLAVWTHTGEKVVSEFISAATLPQVWSHIEKMSSSNVVGAVKAKLSGES